MYNLKLSQKQATEICLSFFFLSLFFGEPNEVFPSVIFIQRVCHYFSHDVSTISYNV